MFYKLIFNESDKRKKIDNETQTFEGLRAFAQKVFKMNDKDVGFLYLGQDDVSAYEITCDEDLEYVLEVSKSSSSDSKFIVIKVIENFESSPENPDKFSRLDASEEDKRDIESFENLSSAIAQSKLIDEPVKEDLRNDLENFDKKIIQKNEEDKEDQEMIKNLGQMIENSEPEKMNMKEFIEESIKENIPDMAALNDEMQKVDIDQEVELEKLKETVIEVKDKKIEKKKIKKKAKKKNKKVKKVKKKLFKKILKNENIKDLASHLTESMMMDNSEDKKIEIENKIGDILNATLSQISQKFEEKNKKMEEKKDKKMKNRYFKFCGKVKNKMKKFNNKMTKFYDAISDDCKKNIPFDTIIWSNQASGFNSMESEHLKMEINNLAASKFQQMDEIDFLRKRCQELETMVNSIKSQNPVERVVDKTKSSVSVETMHLNIICDGCNKPNFKGRRFKCIVCPDFDLCEDCERQKIHSHPMLRMTCNNVENKKLNFGLRMLRKRPRFQKLFNLSSEDVGSNEIEEQNKCRRRKFWWMKKMFGGKRGWGRKFRKRSHSTSSSSSSSEESNSPEKHHHGKHHHHGRHHHGRHHHGRHHHGKHHHGHHHHGRKMWKRFAKNMQKKGNWWMKNMPFGKKDHPMGPNPWFIDFKNNNQMNKEMKNCARPFPGFMGCDFKKNKDNCPKKVKKNIEEQKKEMKETIQKKFENKTVDELIPKKIKEELNGMGVEIVDFYVESKDAPNKNEKLGPNDIKVEIDILPPVETPKTDMMSEDKIIRKSSKKIEVKVPEEKNEIDFQIKCETPERAKSSEEIEIELRKEYVKVMLDNSNINDEILHFFVVNNLDLDKEQFYKLMNEQKKFLSD